MTNFTDKPRTASVLAVFERATADDMREGLAWYLTAHNWCRRSANGRDHLVSRNAGIVAALSPLNGWENNKRKAAQVISMRARIEVIKGRPNGIGLGNNVSKAVRIYNGESPLDVLNGNKVRAFYRTILEPMGDIDPVIDRHAFDIAVGERTSDARRSILDRKGVYAEFAAVYREAAAIAGIGSAQMQAVTWIAWRNQHGIIA